MKVPNVLSEILASGYLAAPGMVLMSFAVSSWPVFIYSLLQGLQWEWKGFISSLFLGILVRKKRASPGLTIIWILLWFKMCLGFCFYSGLERPTDWEMIAIIKMACYSELPRGGVMPCHAEPMRKQQCWSGDRRNEAGEIIGQILNVVSMGRNRWGRISSLVGLKRTG